MCNFPIVSYSLLHFCINSTPNSFLMPSFFRQSCLVHPSAALRKCTSAACNLLSSLLVNVHDSLPQSKACTAITEQNLTCVSCLVFPFHCSVKCFTKFFSFLVYNLIHVTSQPRHLKCSICQYSYCR
jgi:hypothetical protein